ncbi:MAG: hypothetical protein M0Z48_00455 [Nitrospiraceae bacterium]|nr:hypothetical protein [Nitrospiraceae bacterium]
MICIYRTKKYGAHFCLRRDTVGGGVTHCGVLRVLICISKNLLGLALAAMGNRLRRLAG